MKKSLQFFALVAILAVALIGSTISVSAQGVSISSFSVSGSTFSFHLSNGSTATTMKYHVYTNGVFTEWGTLTVVQGEQDVQFALTSPPPVISSAEIVLLENRQEDVRLANAFWSAPPATPTATNTIVPPTPTATNTIVPPTPTETSTTVPPTPTATNTIVPPTPTPGPTPNPTVPVVAEISYEVITQTVQVSMSTSALWHLYLDGQFTKYGEGRSIVIGLSEFNSSFEVVTNPGTPIERKMFVRRTDLYKVYMPQIARS